MSKSGRTGDDSGVGAVPDRTHFDMKSGRGFYESAPE
jgi:hypothetical protein